MRRPGGRDRGHRQPPPARPGADGLALTAAALAALTGCGKTPHFSSVIPAQAGIHASAHYILRQALRIAPTWTPAFAGVTGQRVANRVFPQPVKAVPALTELRHTRPAPERVRHGP
ncbi:hypothetical protein MTBUT4_520014 [Magnetospirillum sp. UT-4]|nr:hypothetical protein MTBUT4_520014 [Magnetospirillum sp. UT-4]